jgi:hypothetical protein
VAYCLRRHDGKTETFLYWWNEKGAAWGPDAGMAHRFDSPGDALDLAVTCGGPANARPITLVET